MSNTKKLVTIGGSGAIPELGYICAPIVNPCPIDIDKVSKIVCSGRKVYAVNPANTSEKVLLTPSTVYNDNFAPKAVAPVAEKVEKKAETPVTKPMTKAERKEAARAAAAAASEAKVEETPAEVIAPDASAADFFKK